MQSFQLATALLATFALASSYASNFECQDVTIDDKSSKNEIKCRLKTAPAKPVQVNLESRFFNFGKCFLTLTTTEWQTIPVTVVPICSDKQTTDVDIKVRIYSADCEEENKKITVHRKFASCAFGSSTGDPHFTCLDGDKYSFMGEGIYDLFYDKQFQVQSVQEPCSKGSKATCNTAIAIRYKNSIMALDLRTSTEMQQVTPNVDGIEYAKPENKSSVHTVILPCGSKVIITAAIGTAANHMNINLYAAASYIKNGGLLNDVGLQKGQYKTRAGQIIQDAQKFAKTWEVAASDNHFKGKHVQCSKPVDVLKCKLPDTCTAHATTLPLPISTLPPYTSPADVTTTLTSTIVAPVITTTIATSNAAEVATTTAASSYAPNLGTSSVPVPTAAPTIGTTSESAAGVVTSTVSHPAITTIGTTAGVETTTVFTTVVVTSEGTVATSEHPTATYVTKAPTQEFIDQVTQACKNVFVVEGCNEILPAAPYIEECIKDATTLGTFDMVESGRCNYMAVCKGLLSYTTADPDDKVVEKAKEIEKASGLDDNACKNDCSGNGVCSANGCTCNPGFSGMDCSNNLAALSAYAVAETKPTTKKNTTKKQNTKKPTKDVHSSKPADVSTAPASTNVAPAESSAPESTSVAPVESSAPVSGNGSDLPIYSSATGYSVVMALAGTFALLL
jgi:hypothetical protein